MFSYPRLLSWIAAPIPPKPAPPMITSNCCSPISTKRYLLPHRDDRPSSPCQRSPQTIEGIGDKSAVAEIIVHTSNSMLRPNRHPVADGVIAHPGVIG